MKETIRQITDIKSQKNKSRVNIFLDGDFAFGLDKEVALEYKLNEGEKLTESQINKILYDENKKKVKQKVLNLLNYRARSIKEIRDKLREKEIPGEIIDEVIEDFIRVGLLDDEKFGAAFVRTRMVKKKVSKRFLLRELKEKGFLEEKAQQIVDDNYGEESENEVATQLLHKKLGKADLSHPSIKKKVTDFLHRRGFGWELIWEVVNEEEGKTEARGQKSE